MSAPTTAPALVHVKIDGEAFHVPKGTSILEVAWEKKKVKIPVLCHEQDRNPVGVCRVCVVNVQGRAYAAACMLKADFNEFKKDPTEADLVIETNTKEVQAARNTVLQLLMSEHPQPCVKPDRKSECELESLIHTLDVPKTPYPRLVPEQSRGVDKSSHAIRVNHDACILCDRCIRACADEKHYVIAREGKGHEAKITFGMGKEMNSSGCVSCGACVIACPTTAITSIFNSPAYKQDEPASTEKKAVPRPKSPDYSAQSQALLKRGEMVDIKDLLQRPAFEHVSRKFLERNLSCVVRREIKQGERLFTEGELGHTAFLIEKGNVDIFMRSRNPKDARDNNLGLGGEPLRTLKPGGLTGEMSCLNCYPRLATAIAKTDCEVLEMLRNVLEMLRNYRFRNQLESQYRERALQVLVENNDLFAPLDEFMVKDLEDHAKLVRYQPDEVIYEQGKPADAFYLISLGFVKVSRKYHGGQFVIKYLGPGSHFGEMSLLAGEAHHCTCTALHHVEVIRIDGQQFQKMLKCQALEEKLRKEAADRLRENQEQWSHLDSHVVEKAEMGLEEAESMLVLDLDKCTRCDQCVIACAETHNGKTRLIRDGLRIENYLVASACRHCHDPLCMVCHWDAITRDFNDKSKAVVIHQDKCVGCGQCAVHCPYGNIKLIDEKGKLVPFESLEDGSLRQDSWAKANSCDLCPQYEVPSCVYACPHDAAQRYSAAEFRSVRKLQSSSRRS